VVAVATDLASLLRSVAESSPDVVLTDIRMPPDERGRARASVGRVLRTPPRRLHDQLRDTGQLCRRSGPKTALCT